MPYYPPSSASALTAEPWPREYRWITIGISRFHGCELSMPQTMSEAEWAMFDQFIGLIKSGHEATRSLVERAVKEAAATSEAYEEAKRRLA